MGAVAQEALPYPDSNNPGDWLLRVYCLFPLTGSLGPPQTGTETQQPSNVRAQTGSAASRADAVRSRQGAPTGFGMYCRYGATDPCGSIRLMAGDGGVNCSRGGSYVSAVEKKADAYTA